jgi:DNA-binding beta-propeller fold protein YncE
MSTRRRLTQVFVGALGSIVLALVTAVATAGVPPGPPGRLVQPAGKAGCLQHLGRDGCARIAPLVQPEKSAVSPDGRYMYVPVVRSNAILIFARDRATGCLKRLRGRRGCVKNRAGRSCTAAHVMTQPIALAISPDGRNVYVFGAGSDSLTAFARNRRTGAMHQLSGPRGCATRLSRTGCARARGLNEGIDVAVSPDGRRVYTAGRRFPGSIAVFDRQPGGGVRQRPGANACLAPKGRAGCAPARGIGSPWSLAVSPDSRNVYVAGLRSDSVAVLSRTPGGLSQAGDSSGCLALTAVEGCAVARGLGMPAGVAVSPDGSSVYVAGNESNAVAILTRDGAGSLIQPAGAAGCVSDRGAGGCASGRALDTLHGIVVSPDGRNLYVASERLDTVSAFARSSSGALTQLEDRWACIGRVASLLGCAPARGLWTTIALTTSPDGRNVYAITEDAERGGIAVLRRLP